MPYSDKELDEIERDPVRLRAWWWRMAMHHKRLARQQREKSRRIGANHPVTNYLPHFEEGADMIRWAGVSERLSDFILENLDHLAVVQSEDKNANGLP